MVSALPASNCIGMWNHKLSCEILCWCPSFAFPNTIAYTIYRHWHLRHILIQRAFWRCIDAETSSDIRRNWNIAHTRSLFLVLFYSRLSRKSTRKCTICLTNCGTYCFGALHHIYTLMRGVNQQWQIRQALQTVDWRNVFLEFDGIFKPIWISWPCMEWTFISASK